MSLFAAALKSTWKRKSHEALGVDTRFAQFPLLQWSVSRMRSMVARSTSLTPSSLRTWCGLQRQVTILRVSVSDPTTSREQGAMSARALPTYPQPARAGDCDLCSDPLRSSQRWQHPLGGPQHAPATPFSRGHQECGWKPAGAWILRGCLGAKSPCLSTTSMNSEKRPP
jgi:hypothetical protein